jgi:hypothetical protein
VSKLRPLKVNSVLCIVPHRNLYTNKAGIRVDDPNQSLAKNIRRSTNSARKLASVKVDVTLRSSHHRITNQSLHNIVAMCRNKVCVNRLDLRTSTLHHSDSNIVKDRTSVGRNLRNVHSLVHDLIVFMKHCRIINKFTFSIFLFVIWFSYHDLIDVNIVCVIKSYNNFNF